MKENNDTSSHGFFGPRPLRSWRLWGMIFLFLYSITGFFVIPYVIKSQMLKLTPEFTGRQIAVEEVKMNPFTLSLTLRGISLADKDRVELAGFDEFHVNFDSFSLFRWAWTFSEIHLSNPRFNLRIDEKGTPSFADLLSTSDSEKPQGSESSSEPGSIPRLLVKHLVLDGGKFNFEDNSLKTPFKKTITPLNFTLKDFSTLPEREGPYGIYVEVPGGGIINWHGDISVNPLRSAGSLRLTSIPLRNAWEYIQDDLRFSLDSGFLSAGLNYNFRMNGNEPDLNADQINVALNKIEIRDKSLEEKHIVVSAIELRGGQLELAKQDIHFNEFAIKDGKVSTFMDTEGNVHLATVFQPVETQSDATEQPAQPESDSTSAQESSSPWQIKLDLARVNNVDFHFTDQNTQPNAEIHVDDINILVSDISNQPDAKFGLQANLKLNETGLIDIRGKVAAIQPMADLQVTLERIPLPSFQAYLNQATNVALLSGSTSLQSQVFYQALEDKPDVLVNGAIQINDLSVENRLDSKKVVSWKALKLDGIQLQLMPDQLHIDSVTLDQLAGDISIAKDGQINVATLVKTSETTQSGENPEPASPEDAEKQQSAEQTSESFPVSVGVVRLNNNAVLFTDDTVSPRFSAHLNKVKGTIKGLSSENLARADVDIGGHVDEFASLKVTGKINPLSNDLYTDLKLKFADYDMVSLTPYTGHYIGKAVDKGRMSFDASYRVSESDLKGENNLILDQFNLGQKIESKDAMNLPVGLAVALLKDTKGVIDFDVPVSGNLDDPQFKISGVIFTALTNVITNIATSPFKMLGKLVGGDNMDKVLFLAGGTDLLEGHDKRLNTLGDALNKRPQLLLEVRGQFELARDTSALQKQKLLAMFVSDKKLPAEGAQLTSVPVKTLEKYYLKLANADDMAKLKAANSKTKEGAAENAPKELDETTYQASLLNELQSKQKISEAELRDLARARANLVRNHLVNVGKLDANRIFVLEAVADESNTKEGISTTFSLTAK